MARGEALVVCDASVVLLCPREITAESSRARHSSALLNLFPPELAVVLELVTRSPKKRRNFIASFGRIALNKNNQGENPEDRGESEQPGYVAKLRVRTRDATEHFVHRPDHFEVRKLRQSSEIEE